MQQQHLVNLQFQTPSHNITTFHTDEVGVTDFTITLDRLKVSTIIFMLVSVCKYVALQDAVTGAITKVEPPLSKTIVVHITKPISLGCHRVFLPWADGAKGIPHYNLKVNFFFLSFAPLFLSNNRQQEVVVKCTGSQQMLM